MRYLIPVVLSLVTVLATLAGEPVSDPDGEEPRSVLTERVTVNGKRLPDQKDRADSVPAHVTVIDRESIEKLGPRTLQELLAIQPGVVLYDQVGNGVETTLDLRGFTAGSGTRVFLDGAPLNDTRNNSVPLSLIPLAAIERVEIHRGSAAALAGGGAEAGVVHLMGRRGGELAGSLSAALGTFDTSRIDGALSARVGGVDLLFSGSRDDTDGFRQNAGGKLERYAGTAGLELDSGRRLDLSWVHSTGDWGGPGSLTLEDYDLDPSAAPYNLLDFSSERLTQVTLNYGGKLGRSFSFASNFFARDRRSEILTTGRSASMYGGFFLDSDADTAGSTLQLTHEHRSGRSENDWTIGIEWLDGKTDALGVITPADDPGRIDRNEAASRNLAERTTSALFVQNSWRPSAEWRLSAGARLDRDRIGYVESVPDPENRGESTFSELSVRAGVTWIPSPRYSAYASYGEGFLPPTVEEMFSFPLFGSNRELRPEDSRSYEVGWRGRWRNGQEVDVALFRVDTDDEIVFDPDSPLGLFGANVNAGAARREGIEVSWRGRTSDRVRAFANLTLTDATFRNGGDRGNTVPLVPRERVSVGLDADLPAGVSLVADALHVGEQVLDNDVGNSQDRLDSYTVVNSRVSWTPRTGKAGGARGRDRWTVFVEAKNLFDRKYATRGIWAFDFLEGASRIFLTPAPGRRYLAGMEWRF
jgi:iron complex outermembrane receptor protein